MERLDQLLVTKSLATSRAAASRSIKAGRVFVDGQVVTKTSKAVAENAVVTIDDPDAKWVSRAALKLLSVLPDDLAGKVAVDLGASTGGFTQALIENGAGHVFAIDVGHDQLHPRLRNHERVTMIEGLNAKSITLDAINHPRWPDFQILTADLSFISLTKALLPILAMAPPKCEMYLLVKPQFELGPNNIGKNGIVKSDALREQALATVVNFIENSGCRVTYTAPSPIAGGDGNIEFMLCAVKETK